MSCAARCCPVLAALVLLAAPGPLHAQQLQPSRLLTEIGIDQKLGDQVPGDLRFRDEAGNEVRLGDYFGSRPLILVPVYYECPMLCSVTLEGLVAALETMELGVGADFQVVTVSIDPGETPELAAANERNALARYGRGGEVAARGWHALVGAPPAIDALTGSIGFRYVYDAQHDQFAHVSGIMILTPDGHLARYLYGVAYSGRDLQLALTEAGGGRIGTLADRVLLLCYHYDPTTGRYGFVIWNAIRLLGLATVALLATSVITMLARERRRKEAAGD